jgi:hypothetical protein
LKPKLLKTFGVTTRENFLKTKYVNMKWKIIYGVIFFISIFFLFYYSNKRAVIYQKALVEEITDSIKNEQGIISTLSHPEKVTRVYQDNFASIGGAIGFGLIAAASILAFALTINKEKMSS